MIRNNTKMAGIAFRIFALSLTAFSLAAQADIVKIPLNTVLKPAGDLLDESGNKLQNADILKRAKRGEDLSKLEPVVDIFWQGGGKSLPATDETSLALKKKILATGGVVFKSHIGGTRELGLYSIFVEDKTDKQHLEFQPQYQLTFGTSVHTSMLRSALLRKLGYFQYSPAFFEEIQIDFASAEEKKEFKETAFCRKIEGSDDELISEKCIAIDPELGPDNPRTEPMIVEMPGTNSLKIRSAYIERLIPKIPSLFNGVTPASINNVETFGVNRSYRSVLVPFAVADLEEGIERIEMETFHLVDGWGFLKLNFGSDFRNTDYYDVKWMLRKMTQLTVEDWNQIVAAAQYPDQCLEKMAYNGLVSRLRGTVQWANYGVPEKSNVEDKSRAPEKLKIPDSVLNGVKYDFDCQSSKTGEMLVKQGRLVKQFIAGSPIRFSHGLRPSPWGKGDLKRLAIVLTQSALLKTALTKLSEALTKTKSEVKETDKVVPTPNGMQRLIKKDDLSFGVGIDGGRFINTGTMLGSNAPVQMVDTLSISAHAGLAQMKLLDINAWTGAATISGVGIKGERSRSFTYVKPIGSMKQAQQTKIWDVLKVESKLEKIAEALNKDQGSVSAFLQAMAPNEVFIITDSISGEGNLGLSQILDAVKVFGRLTNPTISVGVSASYGIVGQTIISRTDEGLQIVVRDLNSGKNKKISVGGSVSVNAFVNLLSIEKKHERLWYDTEVYPINYNPTLMTNICDKAFVGMTGYPDTEEGIDCTGKRDLSQITDVKRREKRIADARAAKKFEGVLLPALKRLIYDSDLTLFREEKGELQKRLVQVKNTVRTTTDTVRAFWKREVMVHENQVIEVFDPVLSDGKTNKGKWLQIAVATRASLRGDDKVGFGLNVFDAIVKEKFGEAGFMLSQNITNPAGMPKGSAEWRVAETQSEISDFGAGEKGKLPPMATLKYIWGGWDINQKDLNQIIAQVNERTPREELTAALDAHQAEHGFKIIPEGILGAKKDQELDLIPDGVFNRVEKIDFYRLSVNLKIQAQGLDNIAKLVFDPEIQTPEVTASPKEKMNWFKRLSKRLARANLKLNQALSGDHREQDKMIFNNIVELYGRDQYLAECMIEKNKNDSPTMTTEVMVAGTTYPCLADWLNRLIQVSRKLDRNNVLKSTVAITEVIYILDEKLPIRVLLNVIGKPNYTYGVNVLGFRAKDQNADQSNWMGPSFGEPDTVDKYRDGLIGHISERSKVSPIILNATQTGL